MKKLFATSVLVLLTLLSITPVVSCAAPTAAPASTTDWTRVNIPGVSEEGNWALATGIICHTGDSAVCFDGQTIYMLADSIVHGYVGKGISFLLRSDDYGRTWKFLAGLEQIELWETFAVCSLDDNLFILSSDFGIYQSSDGGETFEVLPPIPDTGFIDFEKREHSGRWYWSLDAAIDDSGNPVILVGTVHGLGGVWMLSHPYEHWEDLRVGNADANTKYDAWRVAFSPNYAWDEQILALVSDEEHLRVTFKDGDSPWEERIANAQIPDSHTECDLDVSFSKFAFLDDYDARRPVVYIGIGHYTEHLSRTTQYADLYCIEGRPAQKRHSLATDLDVGGKGTTTPVSSVAVNGPANNAQILAGGIGTTYYSPDGGKSWLEAQKPPTGAAIVWLAFDQRPDESSTAYCISTDSWSAFVPRNAEIAVCEAAFCRSTDNGANWNEISLINTTIDETMNRTASPGYAADQTLFMLTRSSSTITVNFDKEESVYITREPDDIGVTAKVIVTGHLGNSPGTRVKAGDHDYACGTGPLITLTDESPGAIIETISALDHLGIRERIEEYRKENPWFVEQYLALEEEPRKAVIYVLDGSVLVTKGEQVEDEEPQRDKAAKISVDGDASDWQGIEPLTTDPEGDAPSKDEDMKAFYTTSDGEYLYVIVELYGQNPRTKCDIKIDADLDGDVDYIIQIKSPDEPLGPVMHLLKDPSEAGAEFICEDIGVLRQVVEARVPLKFVSQMEGVYITQIDLLTWIGEEQIIVDTWQGSLEVQIEEFVTHTSIPSSPPIPFPSTESLWKTIDGGTTWERVLTSGLKLWVDSEEIQVGSLESISLSDNFAKDNTLFVYESGDKPMIWISTDGGTTFTLQR